MATRERRERQRLLAKQQTETYMKSWSRRAKKAFQNFTVQCGQPQTATRGVRSKPRSENWRDTVVERCFTENDWVKILEFAKRLLNSCAMNCIHSYTETILASERQF